jgi:adenylosuccinate synthase
MAKDVEALKPYLTDTKSLMRHMLELGEHIVIEGTQGYGLSNIHAKDYPYATSRDTTAAGFLSETGLAPFDVEHVVMVVRSFPIRVAGHSGPLENEIDWATVSRESGSAEYFEEKTTVTQKIRRVARFDAGVVKEAVAVNKPDILVLNHIDYLDYGNKNHAKLSEPQLQFVHDVETKIGKKADYYGNGEMAMIPSSGK